MQGVKVASILSMTPVFRPTVEHDLEMRLLQSTVATGTTSSLSERILVAAVGPLVTVLLGGLVVWAVTSGVQRKREAGDRRLQEKREDDIRESDRRRADIVREQDDRRDRDKKRFEAEIARGQKVIDAQAQLLTDLTRVLFGVQHLIIEVTYYHNLDRDLFDRSWKKYHERAGESFGAVRAVMGRALWLAPRSSYDDLIRFYYGSLIPADQRLTLLHNAKAIGDDRPDDWADFNRDLVTDFSKQIEALINGLAAAMKLKAPD
jgi:hypothetical protein